MQSTLPVLSRARRQQASQQALLAIIDSLTAETRLSEIARRVVQAAHTFVNADRVSFFLVEDSNPSLGGSGGRSPKPKQMPLRGQIHCVRTYFCFCLPHIIVVIIISTRPTPWPSPTPSRSLFHSLPRNLWPHQQQPPARTSCASSPKTPA